MMEPIFGSPAPMWGAVPSPGLGWVATPIPLGNRGIGAPQVGTAPQVRVPAETLGYAAGAPPGTAAGPLGFTGAFNTFVTTEMPAVPTAGAVIAAVALRRGQPAGPSSDADIEEVLYDALELIPGTSDVEVRCEAGRVTLGGSVPHKRQKRDAGELAWAIPVVNDVQNNVTIAVRRRTRPAREGDAQSAAARKHA